MAAGVWQINLELAQLFKTPLNWKHTHSCGHAMAMPVCSWVGAVLVWCPQEAQHGRAVRADVTDVGGKRVAATCIAV